MTQKNLEISGHFTVSNDHQLTFFAGMNVLENSDIALTVARTLNDIAKRNGFKLVFKVSWDKANRTSAASYRGVPMDLAKAFFTELKDVTALPIVTDIHEPYQAQELAPFVDVLQIPAFLVRQTDLIEAACRTGRPLLLKKMQMMSPAEGLRVVRKCGGFGHDNVAICERGTVFGYHNLVVDMLVFGTFKRAGVPAVFDVSHALQTPGSALESTGGRGDRTWELATAAVSQGIAGGFIECHPNPA